MKLQLTRNKNISKIIRPKLVDSFSPQFLSHLLLTSLEFRLKNGTPMGHLAEKASITSPVF